MNPESLLIIICVVEILLTVFSGTVKYFYMRKLKLPLSAFPPRQLMLYISQILQDKPLVMNPKRKGDQPFTLEPTDENKYIVSQAVRCSGVHQNQWEAITLFIPAIVLNISMKKAEGACCWALIHLFARVAYHFAYLFVRKQLFIKRGGIYFVGMIACMVLYLRLV